ncbi:uncharacterized protein JCM10292_006690 [Rhodotorula paludigena]|uniref:uncharacterized protein n=1 Tax=Rhodotorula paludigena TaxID=86838 RepID=UPI003180F651
MSSVAPPPAFVCRDESPPLQGNRHYVRAFKELSRRLGVPIDRYPAKIGGSGSGLNLEPASEPLFELRNVKPLTRVLPMNGYPEMVFNATELEFHKRDDEQERDKPLELRPLPEPRDEDIDDDDSRLLSYMSEQGLVDSIMYLLNLRAGKVMSAAIGEQAFFVRPTDVLSATDIAAALVSLQPPRMPIKVELCTVLTDDDFMTIIAEMKSSDGEIEFQWP